MRYFVQFSYLGTNYHGSQTQPNGITVQETMEKAFSTVLREPIALTFAGRTDAGVHAAQMVAHFDFPTPLLPYSSTPLPPYSQFAERVNSLLPDDIAVERLWEVSEDMHARFSAKSRTYEYRITTKKDPFLINRATRVAPGLDFEAMNKAAQYLLGTHDFASFCKVHTDVKTTLCTVTQAQWTAALQDRCSEGHPTPLSLSAFPPISLSAFPPLSLSAFPPISLSAFPPLSPSDSSAVFTITADRFLRNMVRAVVGTLFEIGRGKRKPEDILDILEQKNRCSAGQSAPAEGLYLVDITY